MFRNPFRSAIIRKYLPPDLRHHAAPCPADGNPFPVIHPLAGGRRPNGRLPSPRHPGRCIGLRRAASVPPAARRLGSGMRCARRLQASWTFPPRSRPRERLRVPASRRLRDSPSSGRPGRVRPSLPALSRYLATSVTYRKTAPLLFFCNAPATRRVPGREGTPEQGYFINNESLWARVPSARNPPAISTTQQRPCGGPPAWSYCRRNPCSVPRPLYCPRRNPPGAQRPSEEEAAPGIPSAKLNRNASISLTIMKLRNQI